MPYAGCAVWLGHVSGVAEVGYGLASLDGAPGSLGRRDVMSETVEFQVPVFWFDRLDDGWAPVREPRYSPYWWMLDQLPRMLWLDCDCHRQQP